MTQYGNIDLVKVIRRFALLLLCGIVQPAFATTAQVIAVEGIYLEMDLAMAKQHLLKLGYTEKKRKCESSDDEICLKFVGNTSKKDIVKLLFLATDGQPELTRIEVDLRQYLAKEGIAKERSRFIANFGDSYCKQKAQSTVCEINVDYGDGKVLSIRWKLGKRRFVYLLKFSSQDSRKPLVDKFQLPIFGGGEAAPPSEPAAKNPSEAEAVSTDSAKRQADAESAADGDHMLSTSEDSITSRGDDNQVPQPDESPSLSQKESSSESSENDSDASSPGDAKQQLELAKQYLVGAGVEQSDSKAFEWAKKSAEQGNMEAQRLLAGLYEYGIGVEQDLDLANHWYELAQLSPNENKSAPTVSARQEPPYADLKLRFKSGKSSGIPYD